MRLGFSIAVWHAVRHDGKPARVGFVRVFNVARGSALWSTAGIG